MSTQLVGDWKAHVGDRQIDVRYELTSGGSALLETWRIGSNETVSVYHRADEGLALTHYCGQGNQPYLEATTAGPRRVVFEQRRITSWADESSALSRLELTYDGERLTRIETYVDHEGREDVTELDFRKIG